MIFYNVMMIVDPETDDTYWMDGHDMDKALASFGRNVNITKLIAVEQHSQTQSATGEDKSND